MSLLKYLKEELESPNMMAGRSNIWFDRSNDGFECYFKVGPVTYSFLADGGDEYEDTEYELRFRKKIQGNTENIEDTKEIHEAFVKAILDWVELKHPESFFWISSELYPAYDSIAQILGNKLKDYRFVDETELTPEDERADVQDDQPEKKLGRFVFTREPEKKGLEEPEDWYERKLDDNEKTFDTYEKPEDQTINKEFANPLSRSPKLDNGMEYNQKKLS